jgi:HK97 family phage major capsid protein
MDEELKKALADLGVNTVAEAGKKVNEAIEAFRKESEANDAKRDAVNDEKLAKITAELDKFEKVNEIVTKLEASAKEREDADKERQDQLDRIEASLKRGGGTGENVDPEAKAYADAFMAYARNGQGGLTGDRQNVLQVGDDSKAGYLAPKELVMSILKNIEEFSPIRGLVTTRTTGARAIQIPKRTALPSAVWVGETEDRPDTEGLAYGMLDIPVHESTMAVPVTNAMLEDNEFNLEDEIREAVSIAYGKQEGAAVISGTGFKSPQGILNAAGTVGLNSGLATEITADNVIDLKYAIKTAYAQNGSYILNRSTLGKIRKMKDGNGQYLWASGLAAGRPNTIDGESYAEMPDMPNVGAGLKPIVFGDWKRGYLIVDRLDMAMLYDPYTRAGNGQVLYRWRRRLGGAVTIGEAIAVLTVQAA